MPDDCRLYQLALITEAKNEEGIIVKVPVGILVHAVRKRAEGEPQTSKVVGCNCIIVRKFLCIIQNVQVSFDPI